MAANMMLSLNKSGCKSLSATANTRLLKTLPPTKAAFEEQVKRAAYATIIDKTSHQSMPRLPSPSEFGWRM